MLAAARGRAPARTRPRRASTAKPMSWLAVSRAGPMTTTISPRDVVAEAAHQLAEGAAGDLLVELRQLAADGGRAVGREGRERRRATRGSRRGRLEGDHRLGRLEDALELAGAARQEADEAPAVRREPRGDQRGGHRRGARAAPRAPGRGRCRRGSGGSRGPRSPGVPGVGDQGDRVAALDHLGELAGAVGLVLLVVGDQPRRRDLEQLEQAPGPAGVLAGDRCPPRRGRVRARAVMSPRFPIGVGQTVSFPGIGASLERSARDQ